MKKIVTTIIIVLFLGIATLYLYDLNEEPLGDNFGVPYITGNIYELSEQRILIAEGVDDEDEHGIMFTGKAIWLFITEETEILNNKGENISLGELKINQRATAWTTGMIAESYPEQGTAKAIMVDEDENIVLCYIGGCSGELCTKEPEAISTCELLPGMECLKEEMSCELVEEECKWVLSTEAAKCFMEIEKEIGSEVRDSRIGDFFEEAEKILK
jgi:eight-cysteine-cluster-containing protein